MKHKNTNLPLPLKAVKQFEQNYPNCWEYVKYMRNGQGTAYPEWNKLCYIPIAATNAIIQNKYNVFNTELSAYYAALSSWRQYKEIYTFSPELRETLYSQADEDLVVPTEILLHVPYPCLYISFDDDNGFFTFFEEDINTNDTELRFLFIRQDGEKIIPILNTYLHLKEDYTISDGIQAGIELIKKNSRENNYSFDDKKLYVLERYFAEVISKNIQLILYICADNAEIEENPEQKTITRKPAANSAPKDVFREVRSWDVGFKYAKIVNKINNTSDTNNNGAEHKPTSKKRPHTRKGHWHHYWVGSDTNNNRKLILKWTAPMFIGGNSDDTIATINTAE